MQQASYLEGGPLIWMLPLYLHVNQNPMMMMMIIITDDDDDDDDHHHLIELSASNTSIFYIKDNNLSKSQWIFTKFDMCIYIVEICFGIAHWQISSIFDRVICLRHGNGEVLWFHVLFQYRSPEL